MKSNNPKRTMCIFFFPFSRSILYISLTVRDIDDNLQGNTRLVLHKQAVHCILAVHRILEDMTTGMVERSMVERSMVERRMADGSMVEEGMAQRDFERSCIERRQPTGKTK